LPAGFRGTAYGGEPLGPVTAELKDAAFRTVTTTDGLTVSVRAAGCVRPACELRGRTVAAAVYGAAAFTDLAISLAGVNYTLVFAVEPYCTAAACIFRSGLAGVSLPFDVAVGSFAQLVIAAPSPTVGVAGQVLVPTPTVLAADAGGNLIRVLSVNVTASVTAGIGRLLARSGILWRTGTAGSAAFDGLFFDLPSSYAVTFTAISAGRVISVTLGGLSIADAEFSLRLVAFAATVPAQAARAPFPVQPVIQLLDRSALVALSPPICCVHITLYPASLMCPSPYVSESYFV
jgi:hypothetical protein